MYQCTILSYLCITNNYINIQLSVLSILHDKVASHYLEMSKGKGKMLNFSLDCILKNSIKI